LKESVFYVNGRFVPESRAFVGVSDLGLLRGYGVFDYTRTYNREPFRLNDHLERLQNSAKLIGLVLPWSRDQLAESVCRTLQRNPTGEKSVRIVATGGESPDSFTPTGRPSLIIMVKPIHVYPKAVYTQGIKVITFPGRREIPEAKTLNYAQAIRALRLARQKGAEEALYVYDGMISECMVCSFFGVRDDVIVTAGTGVLNGITRKTILELIKGRMPVEYRNVAMSETPSLDEAFLTSSSHEVVPIVQIDQTTIGDGKPGPLTREIMRLFSDHVRRKRK
jgi:branched-chain amino acid aminotransferase